MGLFTILILTLSSINTLFSNKNSYKNINAAPLNYATYTEPEGRNIDAYTYENGFTTPVQGINGDFNPLGSSIHATQQNTIITTEKF